MLRGEKMKRGYILMAVGVVAMLLAASSLPAMASRSDKKETIECSVSTIFGTEMEKKTLSYEDANEMESKIAQIINEGVQSANISKVIGRIIEVLRDYGIFPENRGFIFGKTWGWGVFNYFISYGRGEIFIPLKSDRSFFRMMLRPILFKYTFGVTIAKFGTNYMWDNRNTIGNIGWMVGRQRGFTAGFIGLHIRIPHPLHSDSHIFIGTTLIINGNNLMF